MGFLVWAVRRRGLGGQTSEIESFGSVLFCHRAKDVLLDEAFPPFWSVKKFLINIGNLLQVTGRLPRTSFS